MADIDELVSEMGDEELDAHIVGIMRKAADTIRKLESEKNGLREALESIREQTKCRSAKGDSEKCWFLIYGRHKPDCNWAISAEAEDALKDPE